MARYNALMNARVQLQWWLLVTALATIGLGAVDMYYGPKYNKIVNKMSVSHQTWNAPPGMTTDQFTNWTKTLRFPSEIDSLVKHEKVYGLTVPVGPFNGPMKQIKMLPWWGNILLITAPGCTVLFMIIEWAWAYNVHKAKNSGDVSDAVNEAELKLDKHRAGMDVSAFFQWLVAVPYFAGWHGWYGTFACAGTTTAFCDWGKGAFSVAVVGLFLAGCTLITSIKLGKLKGLSIRDMLVQHGNCRNSGCGSASRRYDAPPPVQRPGPVTGMNGKDLVSVSDAPPAYNKEMEASVEVKYEK